MEKQQTLVYKVVDVVNRPFRKTCVTPLWYIVDNLRKSQANIRLFAKKKEKERVHQNVHFKNKLEFFVCLLDVMISVEGKVITN